MTASFIPSVLDELDDVVITSPVSGQVIRHNSVNWVNAQLAHSDLSGIGANTHAQIDTHIASTIDPHGATLTQQNLIITGALDVNSTAPAITLTDTTASAKSLKIDVDANIAQIREKDGAANSLLSLDLSNNHIGIFTSPPSWGWIVPILSTSTGAGFFFVPEFIWTGGDIANVNTIFGYAAVSSASGVTVTNLEALNFSVSLGGGANATNARAINCRIDHTGTGTITNGITLQVVNPTGSGIITNGIGVRIARQTRGNTRNYGLYYGAVAVGSEPAGNYAAYFDADPIAVGNATVAGGVADAVKIYSTDDAAGHTIPSFYCEGSNVLATGQADSVSSTRVKMRINGTVVTLLAI